MILDWSDLSGGIPIDVSSNGILHGSWVRVSLVDLEGKVLADELLLSEIAELADAHLPSLGDISVVSVNLGEVLVEDLLTILLLSLGRVCLSVSVLPGLESILLGLVDIHQHDSSA